MLKFFSGKNRRIMSTIIIAILVLAMVVPVVLQFIGV